jgi:hypothetical protein
LLLRKGTACYDCKLLFCSAHCANSVSVELPTPHGTRLICDECNTRRAREKEKEKQDLINAFISGTDSDESASRRMTAVPAEPSTAIGPSKSFNEINSGGTAPIVFTTPAVHHGGGAASAPRASIALKASYTQSHGSGGGAAFRDESADRSEFVVAPPPRLPYSAGVFKNDEYVQLGEEDSTAGAPKKSKCCHCCVIS